MREPGASRQNAPETGPSRLDSRDARKPKRDGFTREPVRGREAGPYRKR